jgi:hypothetical protein
MAKANQLQGITSIAEPAPVMAAGGGVVAFQAGGTPLTRQEEVEQYLKDRADIMGEDEYAKALKARAEKESSIYDRLSSAGAQIGLAGSMLRDPSQFGKYAQQAAELQGAQRKSAEQRELAALEAQKAERDIKGRTLDVIEGRREKRDEAQFDRQSKILAANIAARKPTDLKYYAEMRLKASQGDEEAKIIVAGINDYLQQSAIGRNIVAQQGVGVQEKRVDVDLYDKSVTYADNAVSRLRSAENEAYKAKLKQDKENAKKGKPTTLAQDYKDELAQIYRDKAEGKKPAQSGAAPSNAPKGAKLIGTSNGKPVYELPDGTRVIQE